MKSRWLSWDKLLFYSFFSFFISLALIHGVIFYRDFELSSRNLSYLSIGIGYDLLIAAELSALAYFFNFIGRPVYKLALSIAGLCLFIFSFGDYLYYLNFSTHVPFSNVEYSGDFKTFLPSLWSALSSVYMLIVSTVCVLFVNFVLKSKEETNLSLSAKASNLVIMILLAAIGGGYSNPVVYKDLQNPIVSNSFWYVFYTYTNNEKVDKKLEYPEEAVSYLQSHLTKNHTLDKNSFISFRSKTTCSKSKNKDLA